MKYDFCLSSSLFHRPLLLPPLPSTPLIPLPFQMPSSRVSKKKKRVSFAGSQVEVRWKDEVYVA